MVGMGSGDEYIIYRETLLKVVLKLLFFQGGVIVDTIFCNYAVFCVDYWSLI